MCVQIDKYSSQRNSFINIMASLPQIHKFIAKQFLLEEIAHDFFKIGGCEIQFTYNGRQHITWSGPELVIVSYVLVQI